MTYRFTFGRDARVNALLGAGHFLSHFYQLCLPPLFIAWQQAFDVSFAELGLAMAVMSGAAAVMQTPMGFLVDRYGARPFPGRRHPADDPVDRRDGARHRLLADRRAGVAVGGRQLGLSPGGLRDPERVGRSGEIGAVFRLSHLYRACRLCRRPAGDGRADAAARLARRVALVGLLGLPVVRRSCGRAASSSIRRAEPRRRDGNGVPAPGCC